MSGVGLQSLPEEILTAVTEELSPVSAASLASTNRYLRSAVPGLPQRLSTRGAPVPLSAISYFPSVYSVSGPIRTRNPLLETGAISRRVRGNLHLLLSGDPDQESDMQAMTISTMLLDLLFVRSRLYPGSETRIETEAEGGPILGYLLRPSFFLLRHPPPIPSSMWYPRILSLVHDLPLTGFGLLFRHREILSAELSELLDVLNRKDIQEIVVEQWPGPLDLFPNLRTITFLPRSKVNPLKFFSQPRPKIITVIGGKIRIGSNSSSVHITVRNARWALHKLFRLFPNLRSGDITLIFRSPNLDFERLKAEIQDLLTNTLEERPGLAIRIQWKEDS